MAIRRRGQGQAREALEGLLGSLDGGAAGRVRESLAFPYWAQVVGPQAAAATEPESIRDGVLFVRTKSSVWSHELTFLKSHILAELNRRIGRPAIKEIIFRAQGLSKLAAEPPIAPAGSAPTGDELAAVVLLPDEQAALDRELARLASLPDEKLRASLARRVVRDRKLRRWRLDHGWRPCARCQAPHDTEGGLCPICRLCR